MPDLEGEESVLDVGTSAGGQFTLYANLVVTGRTLSMEGAGEN